MRVLLPGARPDDPRRADQPPRPSARADSSRSWPLGGALLGEPRPPPAGPVHHQVLHIANQRLTEWKGLLQVRGAPRGRPVPTRSALLELESREITSSTLADSTRRARRSGPVGQGPRTCAESARTQADKRRQRRQRARSRSPPRSGAIPLEVAKLGVRYGNNEVLSEVTFHAGRGDHIVIIGRNGAGVLPLRCLAGVQVPTNGVVELGANVELGYFAQEHEQIDPDGRTRQRERCRARRPRGTGAPPGVVRSCRPRRPTRCRPPCREASGPSSAWRASGR